MAINANHPPFGYRVVSDIPDDPNHVWKIMDFKAYEINRTLEECARLAQNCASEVRDSAKKRGENPLLVRVVTILS